MVLTTSHLRDGNYATIRYLSNCYPPIFNRLLQLETLSLISNPISKQKLVPSFYIENGSTSSLFMLTHPLGGQFNINAYFTAHLSSFSGHLLLIHSKYRAYF
jgi:hypothetical protein